MQPRSLHITGTSKVSELSSLRIRFPSEDPIDNNLHSGVPFLEKQIPAPMEYLSEGEVEVGAVGYAATSGSHKDIKEFVLGW